VVVKGPVMMLILNCVVLAECLAFTSRYHHSSWGGPWEHCDTDAVAEWQPYNAVIHRWRCNSVKRQSICFRPDTLSPALRWQLAGRRHRVYAARTLPGSSASDNAMQRGNVGTTRVIAASLAVPAAAPVAVSTSSLKLCLFNSWTDNGHRARNMSHVKW